MILNILMVNFFGNDSFPLFHVDKYYQFNPLKCLYCVVINADDMKFSLVSYCLCVIFALLLIRKTHTRMSQTTAAPIAEVIPTTLEKHGDVRIDNYFWLNDRKNPKVIDYLNQENNYYDFVTSKTKKFQADLYDEMKGRIEEKDESVPYLFNGYYYITRYETGQDYPIYSRKKGTLDAPEEIMFDCNEMAKGFKYFKLSGISISKDNQFAIFATDIVGRRIYDLQVKNLFTGEILADKVDNFTGNSTWANDNKTIFLHASGLADVALG